MGGAAARGFVARWLRKTAAAVALRAAGFDAPRWTHAATANLTRDLRAWERLQFREVLVQQRLARLQRRRVARATGLTGRVLAAPLARNVLERDARVTDLARAISGVGCGTWAHRVQRRRGSSWA